MADEVATRACGVLIERLEARGIDVESVLRDVGIERDLLVSSRGRIDWAAFVALLERIEPLVGGPEGLEQLGEEHADDPVFGVFRAAARVFVRPVDLYWISARWYGPRLLRNIPCEFEKLPRGRVAQTLTIPESAPDSPQFFHLTLGVLRSGSRFLGLPNARVEMTLSDRKARYVIQPPPSLTIFKRVRRWAGFYPGAGRRIVQELASQQEELLDSLRSLSESNASLRAEIQERRRVEGQLRQAQKLEAVGRLAAGIAHDFNNLLTAINGFAELALQRDDLRSDLRADLQDIRGAAERATDLTAKLLAFSRSQTRNPVVLDLNDLLVELEPLLRRLLGDEIELKLRTEETLWSVKTDATHAEQVILNLCLNARDAMPQGGILTVETFEVVHEHPEVRPTGECPAGRCVVLAIEDTGYGMTPDVQERIFEPFFSTKSPDRGTGLGLSTVYGIVRQSGGQIHVESEPGKGTRIEVHLPASREQARPQPAIHGAPPTGRGSETVLLVEDDARVRRLARRSLEGAGYRVIEAADGLSAVGLPGEDLESVELLITDVRMPRMSGPEVAQWLRRSRGSLPVLYVSGYPDVDLDCESTGAVELLRKPFSPAALSRKVRELLDEARAT